MLRKAAACIFASFLVVVLLGLAFLALASSLGAARNPLAAQGAPGNNPASAYPVSCSRPMTISFDPLRTPLEYAIFGPITSCSSVDLRTFVRTYLPYLRAAQAQAESEGKAPLQLPTFTVSLNSPGGSWTDTLSMLDSLRLLNRLGKMPLELVITGQVRADAVWFFTVAPAERRFIAPDAIVVFEWPFQVPGKGFLGSGSATGADEQASAWLAPLASALRISVPDLKDLLNRKAAFYGFDVVRMGWARPIEDWNPVL